MKDRNILIIFAIGVIVGNVLPKFIQPVNKMATDTCDAFCVNEVVTEAFTNGGNR